MKETTLKKAKRQIIRFFDQSPINVYKHSDIKEILFQNRDRWRLAASTTVNSLLTFMLDETELHKLIFNFPYRTDIRYAWGDVSDYEVIISLRPQSYLTHYTAMYLHNLTEQIPKTMYLNYEQPPKISRDMELEQSRIDAAFRRPVRLSKSVSKYKNLKICLLNGMYTGRLGVIEIEGMIHERIHVTNPERTLIDITVRPEYSGGVFEVLKAYRIAKQIVSINKLCAILKKLNYIYPYHQAIGFYLDRSGAYENSQIDLLREFYIKFDFYLAHQMADIDYSKQWRLYFPKGL